VRFRFAGFTHAMSLDNATPEWTLKPNGVATIGPGDRLVDKGKAGDGPRTIAEPACRIFAEPSEAGPRPRPRLTPRQEYIASVCRECEDNLTCTKAYAEGCSSLQTS